MRASCPLLLLAALATAGCGDHASRPGPGGGKASAPRSWSSDEMAKDPEGYLAWADGQLAAQVKQREEFLQKLAERRAGVTARQQRAGADLTELENFLQRLTTAVRRAQDEDRWPVQVGDRRFEQARAQELLTTLPKQIELRRPLADEYVKALTSMQTKDASVRNEIGKLGELRELVALDLERVRLNRGAAELGKLGEMAGTIEHYAKILGEINAEAANAETTSAPPKEGGLISLDNLMK